jgi:hypothetical protein
VAANRVIAPPQSRRLIADDGAGASATPIEPIETYYTSGVLKLTSTVLDAGPNTLGLDSRAR